MISFDDSNLTFTKTLYVLDSEKGLPFNKWEIIMAV